MGVGVTIGLKNRMAFCPLYCTYWTLLYITIVWLLSSECSDFFTHVQHSIQSWDPLGWTTHQLTWSLWWRYFPGKGKEKQHKLKTHEVVFSHIYTVMHERRAHTHTRTHRWATAWIRTSVSKILKLKINIWLQLPSIDWCSGFVQYLYLYIIKNYRFVTLKFIK